MDANAQSGSDTHTRVRKTNARTMPSSRRQTDKNVHSHTEKKNTHTNTVVAAQSDPFGTMVPFEWGSNNGGSLASESSQMTSVS